MENFQFGSQHIQILFNKFGEFKEALLNDSPHEINTVQASRWMNSPVGIVKVNFDVAIYQEWFGCCCDGRKKSLS